LTLNYQPIIATASESFSNLPLAKTSMFKNLTIHQKIIKGLSLPLIIGLINQLKIQSKHRMVKREYTIINPKIKEDKK
jgi:hypothetical protein